MIARRIVVFLTALGLLAGCLISAPKLLHPFNMFADFRDAISHLYTLARTRDLTFEENLDPHVRGLVTEARRADRYFKITPYDAYTEQIVTELALPNLPAQDARAALHVIGPHTEPATWEKPHTHLERWGRMLLALVCWIGVTAFIVELAFPLRVLTGALITGWSLGALSYLTGLPLTALYPFWIPVSLCGACYLLFARIRARVLNWRALGALALFLAFFPEIWSPFFFADLHGPDARTMWFYRYKFEFLHGFRPDLIREHMADWSQRDYPWFLGGAVGIASWKDTAGFAGWSENAAFGSLFWIVLATLSLWARLFSRYSAFLAASIIILTFGACNGYITNGYMDGLWIPLFAFFLYGYFARASETEFSQTDLWLALAVAASLKYEAFACFAIFAFVEAIRRLRISRDVFARFIFGELLFWGTAFAPALLGKFVLRAYGIFDQYAGGARLLGLTFRDGLHRFASAHRFIFKRVFFENPHYAVPLVLLLVLGWVHRRFGDARRILGGIYLLSLPAIVVYTLTPYDQTWHLETSAFRVLMIYPFFGALALVFVSRRSA